MPKKIDRTGRRYTRLLVIGEYGRSPAGAIQWECKCDCGKTVIVLSGKLDNGGTKSCGCYRDSTRVKHGMHLSSEYSTWKGMISRCTRPKNRRFHRYGGRGINVCDRWRVFENFLADMGRKPSPRHTIERRDVNGDYCHENCIWLPKPEQAKNTSQTIRVMIDGSEHCLKDACRMRGLNYKTIRNRISDCGWSIDNALTIPVGARLGRYGRPT